MHIDNLLRFKQSIRIWFVDARGQRRMTRLIQADRKTTATKMTTHCNKCTQKSISECKTLQTLKQLGFSCRKPHHCMPLLSAKNTKLRLRFIRAHQNLTLKDWKNCAQSDEFDFCCNFLMLGSNLWIHPALLSMVQTGGDDNFYGTLLGPLVPTEHRLNTTVLLSILLTLSIHS